MSEELFKLNLGCGNKRLEGYVGVDLDPQADIVCDLRKLSFAEDNSVDEILSVHVIEHFYLWEVQPLLQEWRRVLKPVTGKIILECPNLEAICRNLLMGSSEQMSMWGLYGNPDLRNELHCHHWGYTPESLKDELIRAGFKKPISLPAKFKIPARDMRVEAYK